MLKTGDKIRVKGFIYPCLYLMQDKRYLTMSWITLPNEDLPVMVQDTMITVVYSSSFKRALI